MSTWKGGSTRKWRQFRAQILKAHPPICCLCGGGIDLSLSGRHPNGPSVHHTIALADGVDKFDPTICRPAHSRCNLLAGAATAIRPRRTNSREW